jgi:hypothetical protein
VGDTLLRSPHHCVPGVSVRAEALLIRQAGPEQPHIEPQVGVCCLVQRQKVLIALPADLALLLQLWDTRQTGQHTLGALALLQGEWWVW